MMIRFFFSCVCGAEGAEEVDGSIISFKDISTVLHRDIFRSILYAENLNRFSVYHTSYQMSSQKKEYKRILAVGTLFLQDTALPVAQRIRLLREWFREYREEKQRLQMEQFRKINGFEATDDETKRAIIDEVHYEVTGRYPADDKERNLYTKARNTPLMQVGWRPCTF